MEKTYIMKMYVILFLLLTVGIMQVSAYPRVVISGFTIKEGSATVGQSATLVLNITDVDPQCALGITTNVQASPPFILKGTSSMQVGDICQGTTKQVEIPMRIDPTGTGGTYQLSITNKYLTSSFVEYSATETLNIFISGSPELNAHIVNSNPVDVYPGDTATLTINLENAGSFMAQSVNAQMTADSPIIVKWSKSYAALDTIGARQSKNVDFSFEVPKDAKIADYPLSLTVTYLDENSNLLTKEYAFSLHIKDKALFSTLDDGTGDLYVNQNSRIVKVLLKNTGTATAYKLRAKLQPEFPISTDGSVRYIDAIKPGESLPVDFVVNVDKDGAVGTYGLDMILNFEDAQGNKLDDTTTVSLTVAPKNFFRYVFIDYWFLWAIVVLIVIITAIKKSKPKKK